MVLWTSCFETTTHYHFVISPFRILPMLDSKLIFYSMYVAGILLIILASIIQDLWPNTFSGFAINDCLAMTLIWAMNWGNFSASAKVRQCTEGRQYNCHPPWQQVSRFPEVIRLWNFYAFVRHDERQWALPVNLLYIPSRFSELQS